MHDVSDAGQKIRIVKNAPIYLEGEQAINWYEIESGVVRTCRYLSNGARQVTGFFVKGQVFGVESARYRATAEAVTDVTVVARPRKILETHAMAQFAAPTHPLSLALQNAEERIHLLVRKGAPARLAGFLLTAAVEDGDGYSVHLPMPRADIADYIAIDVATVSRILSRLVRQRVLTPRSDQGYWISDRDRLVTLAGTAP